jgi:hypothetical protein
MKWKNHFNDGTVFKPRDAFLYQKRYFTDFLDLEFTIPMQGDQGFADVVAGFWQLVDRMEAWRGDSSKPPFPINLSVHARFIKNSQALLSPALAPAGSPTHTCYIEYLSYAHGHLTTDYDNFSKDFYSPEHAHGWKRFGGIPNWGKDLGSVPGVASYVHDIINAGPDSRLQQFLRVRDAIDPRRRHLHQRLPRLVLHRPRPPRPHHHRQPRRPTRPQIWPQIWPKRLQTRPRRPAASPWPRSTSSASRPRNTRGPTSAPPAPLELIHDLAHGVAYLTNEHDEVNILAVTHDPATHRLTYTTISPSQHLQPAEILDRVQSLHKP